MLSLIYIFTFEVDYNCLAAAYMFNTKIRVSDVFLKLIPKVLYDLRFFLALHLHFACIDKKTKNKLLQDNNCKFLLSIK